MFFERIILFLKVGGVWDSEKDNGLEVRNVGFNYNSSTCLFNFSLSYFNYKIGRRHMT